MENLTHERFLKNGEKVIQQLISDTKAKGQTTVVLTGNYLINETVILSSNTTLLLKDCHLRLADGVFCNMFRNEHCYDTENRTRENADRNIKIIGEGRAILDGGNYNGLSERNSNKDGMPSIYNNNTVLFSNVENFEIRNLKVTNQRWWALNFLFCRRGKITDIDFLADYTMVENGVRVLGLDKAKAGLVYVRNADGIDLRVGCHDIIIENITGFTGDDTVALTALPGKKALEFAVQGEPIDIYNVTIKNVMSSSFHTIVRLLNQGASKIYNILIDGVTDTSLNCEYYKGRGVACVRIGDQHLYGERNSTKDETFNIAIKNIYSRGNAAVNLVGEMTNVKCENIFGFDGCPVLINDEKAKLY